MSIEDETLDPLFLRELVISMMFELHRKKLLSKKSRNKIRDRAWWLYRQQLIQKHKEFGK